MKKRDAIICLYDSENHKFTENMIIVELFMTRIDKGMKSTKPDKM